MVNTHLYPIAMNERNNFADMQNIISKREYKKNAPMPTVSFIWIGTQKEKKEERKKKTTIQILCCASDGIKLLQDNSTETCLNSLGWNSHQSSMSVTCDYEWVSSVSVSIVFNTYNLHRHHQQS